MKRLALLLAAMGIISVGAMAEELKVTNFGQEIEIENSDGGVGDIDSIYFANTVGLKYGTWSFAVQGGKFWSWDSEKGFNSENARLQIDAWKQVSDNLKLGYRLRAQKEYDRHYARWAYTNDWFWSSGDVWYEATNQSQTYAKDKGTPVYENDWVKAEVFPVGVKYGDLKVGYFLNYEVATGDVKAGEQEDKIEHQIRLYYPLYKGEKFSLNFEGRFTIAEEKNYKDTEGKETGYRHYDDFGRTRLYLRPSYKVSDSLTVYGYYGYEFKDYKYENGKTRADFHKESDNYQDIGIGWNYTF